MGAARYHSIIPSDTLVGVAHKDLAMSKAGDVKVHLPNPSQRLLVQLHVALGKRHRGPHVLPSVDDHIAQEDGLMRLQVEADAPRRVPGGVYDPQPTEDRKRLAVLQEPVRLYPAQKGYGKGR